MIAYQILVDDPDLEIEVARGGLDLTLEVEKAAGEPLGAEIESAIFDAVRTCDNHCEFCFIHQLPARPADEPLPARRRLPVVVPLRQLHHAHPVHRDGPRAGADRAPVAPVRLHSRDRSRCAHRDAAQSARGDQLALAAGSARRRRPGPRSGRRLPGRQRRRGARGHHGRDRRPLPRAGHRGRRPAGDQSLRPGGTHAPAHRRGGRGDHRHHRGLAAALSRHPRPADGLRRRRVLPARPTAVPRRRHLRRLPAARGRHRHGSQLRARVQRRGRDPDRPTGRLLPLGRRRPGRGLPGAPGPGSRCGPGAPRPWPS